MIKTTSAAEDEYSCALEFEIFHFPVLTLISRIHIEHYVTARAGAKIVGHLNRTVGPKIEDILSVAVELKGQNERHRLASTGHTLPRAAARFHVGFTMESLFLPQNACCQML
jgi:hypothetical protein